MAQLGQFALALAFTVAVYAIAASLYGIRIKNDRLIASGRNAGIGVFASLTGRHPVAGIPFSCKRFLDRIHPG